MAQHALFCAPAPATLLPPDLLDASAHGCDMTGAKRLDLVEQQPPCDESI